jgi:outer membrane protein insertion porin family
MLSPKTRRLAISGHLQCLFLLALGANLCAQSQPPSSYEGFEGRIISKVDLSADPSMDLEPFRKLIDLKAGQPFSVMQVRKSAAALQKTSLFSTIQVSVEPEQQGLRVLFVLQPAPYVGMIYFPGATTAFAYTRLLQIVNVPDQTAYVPDLVPKGKDALLHLFQEEGFFTATVEAETKFDQERRAVDITYRCRLGPRAKFGDIAMLGIPAQQADELRDSLHSWHAKLKGASLTARTVYSQGRIRKAIDFLRSHFRDSGYLTPDVRFASSSYRAGTNRADINFNVQPGPLISIRVSGAKVSKKTLRRILPIFEENAVDSELVAEGQRNLVNYFQSKSYFDAKVESHFDEKETEVAIVYNVDRGGKHRLDAIHFEGNHYFNEQQLTSRILLKKSRFVLYRGYVSNDALRKSTASITALYKNAGFADANVAAEVRDREPAVAVTFRISEGEQDKVRTLQTVNSLGQEISLKTVVSKLNLRPNKPYSPQLLEEDRNKIVAEYLNNGFFNVKFESHVNRSEENSHAVAVVYVVDTGNLSKIGQVNVLGPRTAREAFIRQITKPNVEEGQPLSEGKFLTAESDLYTLGIFDWASVGPLRPISDQSQEEVLIKVHEAKRNTMDVGGGIEVIPRSGNIPVGAVALPGIPPISLGSKFTTSQKSFFGPRVTFDLARRDMFGRAETAQLGFVVSRLDQRGTLSYTDPHIFGISWSSILSFSGERTTENPIYTAALGQGSLQFEKSFDRKRTKLLRFRYSYQRTDLTNITIPDLVLPQDQHVRTSTFAVEYVRDDRDNPLDAHRGIFQTFTIGVTPVALGSSSNFVRFIGQTSFYRPVTHWLTWANNFRFGVVPTFAGSYLPLSERFFSGGPDSLRGFPINGAGPQRPVQVCSTSNPTACTLISVPVGGEMLAIWNSEARFPIPLKKGLGGVIFYDGGNVYSNISFSQFRNNYSNSVGVGLRYHTPVGPIRFDLGRNVSPIPGVKATQYFITVGQAF